MVNISYVKYIVMQIVCHALSFIIRNALVRFENLEKSVVVVRMYGGSEYQNEVLAKQTE